MASCSNSTYNKVAALVAAILEKIRETHFRQGPRFLGVTVKARPRRTLAAAVGLVEVATIVGGVRLAP